MRKLIIVVALLATSPAHAQVAKADGPYTFGTGLQSCGKWTANRREDDWSTLIDLAWLTGYISGMNGILWAIDRPQLDNFDVEAMRAWVDNYCAANPLDSLSTAAQKLVVELSRRRG